MIDGRASLRSSARSCVCVCVEVLTERREEISRGCSNVVIAVYKLAPSPSPRLCSLLVARKLGAV